MLVDTEGLLLSGVVHAADLADRNAVPLPLAGSTAGFPRLRHLWVDAGSTGTGVAWIAATLGWSGAVVKRPPRRIWWPADSEPPPLPAGFQVLPRRWVGERTFAWLGRDRRLSEDDEVLPATTEAWMDLAMSTLMANVVKDIQGWMRDTKYPGPVIAALAHVGLISIHPFEDGNGRTARLLADMILHQTGWSNEGMLSVSEAIHRRQQEYCDALHATQGENFCSDVDATLFVAFHTDILNLAAASLESTVVSFNRQREAFVERCTGLLNARQALAFMFMLDVAPQSTTAFADLTDSSQSAALSNLTQMVQRELVERVGQGRNTRYRVSDLFRREITVRAAELEALAGEASMHTE